MLNHKKSLIALFIVIFLNIILASSPSSTTAAIIVCVPGPHDDGICPPGCAWADDHDCARGLEVPIPPEFEKTPFLTEYIEDIYNFALGFVAIVCFGALVYGGIRYIASTGNPVAMSNARDWISGAFLGLIILLASYLLLTTINPELWIISAPTVAPIAPPPGTPILPICFSPEDLRQRGDLTGIPGPGNLPDCIINIHDATLCAGVRPPIPIECDFDKNKVVDELDREVIRVYWGVDCCGPSHITPEMLSIKFGDVNSDCVINAIDVAIVAKAVGSENLLRDLNHDGVVDACDVSILSTTFGWTCGQALDQGKLYEMGDFVRDCVIDIKDVTEVSQLVGTVNPAPPDDVKDLNEDGKIDACDVTIISKVFFGTNCGY